MPETFNGCHYTEVWASPKNWETISEKKSLQADWFVQCNFFDPSIPNLAKNGFQFRRRVNKIKGVENRRNAIRFYLEEFPKLLSQKGYNPITGKYFIQEKKGINRNPEYNSKTPIKNALDLAYNLTDVTGDTLKDIKSVKHYFKKALRKIGYHAKPIDEVNALHIRQTMDVLCKNIRGLSDKRYNKYIAYLSSLFRVLIQNGVIQRNPLDNFNKKKVEMGSRLTLTPEERLIVQEHLSINFPEFYRFTVIFFHSGGRIVELLRLKAQDVDLEKMEYKTLVLKGGKMVKISRPIKRISLPFWTEALNEAKPGQFVFSAGLKPGASKIRRDQVTRRWNVHVKKKLNIKADFYSLKHTNLDEISTIATTKEAARAAGHTNTRMVEKHYAVSLAEREMETVRQMRNTFAPEPGVKRVGNCAPCQFNFGAGIKNSRSAG